MGYRKIKSQRMTKSKTFLSMIIVMIIAVFISLYQQRLKTDDAVIDGIFEVSFIDIGQGDSTLIRSNTGEFMLIDTGEGSQYSKLAEYLARENVDKLKYAVFTHPHADHIGAADKIIENFEIETLIMPDVSHNTKTFERLIAAAEEKNLEITAAEAGAEYQLGGAKFLILAPLREQYENLNDYSAVIYMSYGETTFLFTGDAEKTSEGDIVDYLDENRLDLYVNVVKVPHHGSSTSSTQKFLDKITPEIAVISCGAGNNYNHPHKETVERYEKIGAAVFRTDILGSVKISSDGKSISLSAEKMEADALTGGK